MKATLTLAATVVFATSSAFASNGTHLSSISSAAAGMGGVSVAKHASDIESFHRNPSLIGADIKDLYKPRAEISLTAGKHNAQGAVANASNTLPALISSKDSLQLLPAASVAIRAHDKVHAGFGFVTYGGSTIDYTGEASLQSQKSEMQLFRLLPGISVTPVENVNLGAALVVGLSRLSINSFVPGIGQTTRGLKDAWGLGGLFGASVSPIKGVRLGASYLTKTKFKFDKLFELSTLGPNANPLSDDNLTMQEPAEISAGISYECGNMAVAFEYRNIGWSKADGYSNLGWSDQNVLALGATYKVGALTLRGGVNYAKSPTRDASGINGDEVRDFQGVPVYQGYIAQQNLIGFASITEWEGDLGAGYQVNERLGFDLAVNYTPSKTVTQSGDMTYINGAGQMPFIASTKVNEWAVVGAARYQF